MKLNLKTTNDENAAATPTYHQMGQRTVNGIIGNTRRGIVVDKTLDPDSNNPVANKAVATALAALVAETTQTFVSNATALTEGKIAKTSIVGGNSAKCKVGDIVLVADGNIYKISAIDETDITLVLPALASYATATGASIQSIDGYAVSNEKWEIATDLTNIKLMVPFVLNLYEDNTLSGEPTIRVVMTTNVSDLYYLGIVSFLSQTLVVIAKDEESGKYALTTSDIPSSTKNTLFNKPIMVPDDNWDGPTPILPCSMDDNGKVLSVVNGEAQWSNASGLAKIQCIRKDYQDLTKGGTINNSILPTIDVPFILEVGMDGSLESGGNNYKGKLDFLMNYYHDNKNSGDHKESWFGYANDSTGYYTAYIKEGQDVVFAQYVNTNAKIVDIELPTKAKPITSTTNWSIADITSGILTIQNHYDVYLFGNIFNKYRSPVYSDINGTLYYYIIDYDLDGGDDQLTMKYIEIPTSSSSSSTITITFKD